MGSLIRSPGPDNVIKKTKVENCFVVCNSSSLPPNWNSSAKGFQVMEVIENNFTQDSKDNTMEMRKTVART